MVDGSFWTLNTKRSFQMDGSFCCHVLFFVHCHTKRSFPCIQKDLFIVTYYFLSTVTQKDLFPAYKKIFSLSRIIFCPPSHKRIFSLNTKRSFHCHVLFFVHCHTKRSFSFFWKDLFSVTPFFFVPESQECLGSLF
jgi:hypothetical protein